MDAQTNKNKKRPLTMGRFTKIFGLIPITEEKEEYHYDNDYPNYFFIFAIEQTVKKAHPDPPFRYATAYAATRHNAMLG